jgi:hypothetical protein
VVTSLFRCTFFREKNRLFDEDATTYGTTDSMTYATIDATIYATTDGTTYATTIKAHHQD